VVSNDLFNEHRGPCIICPITSTYRDFLFHVAIPPNRPVGGFIMVEQVKSVDFRTREAKHIGQAQLQVME